MAETGDANARVEAVDLLRGFALMALFLVHMLESYGLYWADPRPGPIVDLVFLLFMGKSFSLLALCFGFSFFVLMDRAARRGQDFTGRFAWRLLILEAIGFLHALVYRGDIIQLLAALGLVLLAAHRIRSNRLLIALAVLLFLAPTLLVQLAAAAQGAEWANLPPRHLHDPLLGPVYLHGGLAATLHANLWAGQLPKWWFAIESGRLTQILGLYLLGMVLGRTGFFARLDDHSAARRIALGIAAVAMLGLHAGRGMLVGWFASLGGGAAAERVFGTLLASWIELAGTFVWALLLLALWQSGARRLMRPFARAGRLTLTLYIAQSLVFVPVFYGFGLGRWDDWDQPTRLTVGLAGIAAQLALAAWWLARFRYGPVEWGWRALTYGRRDIPFLRPFPRRGAQPGAISP